MSVQLSEITSAVEKYISTQLVLAVLRSEWEPDAPVDDSGDAAPDIFLYDLYADVREYFAANRTFGKFRDGIDIPAGIFNKVIDDMTRIGLLTVDRKTKRLVYVAYGKLVSEDEWVRLKGVVRAEHGLCTDAGETYIYCGLPLGHSGQHSYDGGQS